MYKIGYFADGPWSHKAMEKILSDNAMQIAFVCGRYGKTDEILKKLSILNNIPFITEQYINSEKFVEFVKKFNCDLLVSMSFNQIFKEPLMDSQNIKIINCHAGKLPEYRGRNILNWVLINDEKEFGVTVHFVDKGIDTGDIIHQSRYKISDLDDYQTLLTKAYTFCAEDLYVAIKSLQNNNYERVQQTSLKQKGFYCSKRKEGDEIIDWNKTSREIFCFIRALCEPGPSAQSKIANNLVKINKAEFIEDAPTYKDIPGSVLFVSNSYFLVKTGDSFIKIKDYSSSYTPRIGDRFQ